MKKRHLYSLLFGIPGFFISVIISFIVFGAAAGFLWIYVSGDKPRPSSIGTILPILFILTFLATWITSIIIGFVTGNRLEKDQALNTKHILISIGATIVPILLVVLHQLSAGNIGPKSESIRCGDFCTQKGYSVSDTSPKNSGEITCSCLDGSGHEIMKIPIDSIAPDK